MPISLKAASGGGSVPVNSTITLYDSNPVVTIDGNTYLRTGYLDSNVNDYPLATKRKWHQLPGFRSDRAFANQVTWGSFSRMQYRFNRWIIASHNLGSSTDIYIHSWANFNTAPTLYSGALAGNSGETQPAVMVWDAAGNRLLCYFNRGDQVLVTTDGVNWSGLGMTGVSGKQVVDVIQYSANNYVGLFDDGIYTSTNATTWTRRQSWTVRDTASTINTMVIAKLATDGSRVVAMVRGKNIFYTSTDTITWTSTAAPSDRQCAGYVEYSNNQWACSFNDEYLNTYSALSNTGTTWTVSSTTGFAPQWHPLLNQYTAGTNNLSKDGLNWISATPSSNYGNNGNIYNWVIVGDTTYGINTNASNVFAISARVTPECVGIPYSLQGIAVSPNTYIRVK